MEPRAGNLLEIRTLGGLILECSGRPIAGIVSRKVEALLVYLACTRRPHTREVLAELLWPDRSQSQSLANLRVGLSNLRRVLPSHVQISRRSVFLLEDVSCWLDVAEFECLIAQAGIQGRSETVLTDNKASTLARALDLYRGDFLQGFYLPDSRAFEDWAELERERLRRIVIEALHHLVLYDLQHGAYVDGIARSSRLLSLDPLHEEVNQHLIELLAQAGQRTQALTQYEAYCRLLDEELGVQPSPALASLVRQIQAGGGAPMKEPQPAPVLIRVANPYKGLRAFQEADAEDFFGREALVGRLLARLEGDDPQARFLAVVGPSGCGKSSVVRAGLLPALREGALPSSDHWLSATLMPGLRPLDELAAALRRTLPLDDMDVVGELARDPRSLLRVVKQALPDDSRVELVLLIDQFEELFSLVGEDGVRRHFLDSLLAALADPHSRLRIVITLRADFYDRPLLYPALGDWVRQRTEVVLPLSPEESERAIAGPAERVNVQVEPALIAAIVADISEQPGALPLLQYTLTELFERRESDRLTLTAYQERGGVRGTVASRAEGLYAALDPTDQTLARQVFLRLVQLGEGNEDIRRRVLWAEVVAVAGSETSAHAVIDCFVQHRLLTLDIDLATGGRTVELAHEALIREWHRLHIWIDECRADLRQQRLLSAAAADWLQAGEDRSYLLTGSRLAQFEDWVASTTVILTPDERLHLDVSIAEHRRQRIRRRRARRATLAAAVAIALIMAVLSLLALDREREAQEARARAEREAAVSHSILLGRQAQAAQTAGYTNLALALALEAATIDQPPSDVVGVLADIAFGEGTRYTIAAHDYSVKDVAMSPDELWGLSGSCLTMDNSTCVRGVLTLWDLSEGAEVRRFEGHLGWVNSVAFSPDGEAVLSGSADKTVVLWDVSTGEIIRRFEGHTAAVNSVAFSPDGQAVLSGSADTTLILWDIATGEIIRRFEGHTAAVNGVAFSPDGQAVLSGSADTTLILWDAATGAVTRRFEGHTDAVNSVAFSPDGSLVLSGDEGSWLRVYDARSGEEFRDTPHTYGQAVTDVSISPSGRAVISTIGSCLLFDMRALTDLRRYGGDYLRNIWAAAIGPSGRVALIGTTDGHLGLLTLESHAQIRRFGVGVPYFGLAISPDGAYLLTGNVAQQHAEATLWDLATGTEVRRLEGSNGTSIFDVAFSPDGRYAFLAVSNLMGDPDAPSRIVMWDVETGEEVPRFDDGLAGWTLSVAVSPDGRHLLSSSASMAPDRVQGGLLLWDVETGQVIREFTTVNTGSVVFSADGSRALSGTYWGSDGQVSLWDVATGQEIRRFERGHYPGDAAFGVAFGPGETTVISGSSDSVLVVWDVETGRILRRFVGHDGAVWSRIRVSKDGRYVLSASYGDVILWDFETGSILHHFRGYSNWGNVVFGPDEQTAYAASGSASDGIIEWKIADLPLDELIEWTYAHRFVRELTCSEREQYRVEPLCK
jgi:WD40 repeat protein/DNA-binding SARP family transcriptional activator